MPAVALIACVAVAAGCDPSAKAQNGEGTGHGQPSSEYESCGSTAECGSGLHCGDGICRSPDTVVVGDYYAALGKHLFATHDSAGAVNAFAEAINQYKAAGREPPLSLYCAQGHILAAARTNGDLAEQAARVLHRCVRLAPVGSALRRHGLADLALLGEVGLDPLLLATESADKYLTKAPMRPSSDKVKLTLSTTVSTHADSFSAFQEKVGGTEARNGLVKCWEQYNQDSGKDSLAMTFRFKYRFVRGVYESQDGYKLQMYDPETPGDGKLAAAVNCAKPVIEQLTDGFSQGSGSWDGAVTFTLAP